MICLFPLEGNLNSDLLYPRHPNNQTEKAFGPQKHSKKAPNLRRYDWMSRVTLSSGKTFSERWRRFGRS